VVGAVHDELRRLRDGDEFADDELVADEVEMIAHAAGDEMLRPRESS
jgi:hypothetical protein